MQEEKPSLQQKMEEGKQEKLPEQQRGAVWHILLSDRAHIVFDFHRQVDGPNENRPGRHKIGTTKEGIGTP